MKYLVVLSGGQDSTTCLFIARDIMKKGDELHAVTFDYNQRHRIEIDSAIMVAQLAHVDSHEVIKVPGCLNSVSPLVSNTNLERYKDATQMEQVIGNRVELTFVPMRNTLFLTVAFNRAVELGCTTVVTGVCQEDNANYPDCTAAFIAKFEQAANEGLGYQRGDSRYIGIVTPLMYMTKAETCRLAFNLGDDAWTALAHSHTSYDGKYPPTDMNHSNVLRAKGFEDANLPDPLVLRAYREGLMGLPETKNYAGIY